jgi:excisionase family DNA binding protein
MSERFNSVEVVAEQLQVDKQTVRRWIKEGRLAAVKPGLEWRIRQSDLDEFLEARSYPKVQAPLSPAEDAEQRMLQETIPPSFEEILESAGAASKWAALPDESWKETLDDADAEKARQIYDELEAERLATFWLRRAMFAQEDVEPRNLATHLTGRFMVRGSQAALKTRDVALIEGAESVAAEELAAT